MLQIQDTNGIYNKCKTNKTMVKNGAFADENQGKSGPWGTSAEAASSMPGNHMIRLWRPSLPRTKINH